MLSYRSWFFLGLAAGACGPLAVPDDDQNLTSAHEDGASDDSADGEGTGGGRRKSDSLVRPGDAAGGDEVGGNDPSVAGAGGSEAAGGDNSGEASNGGAGATDGSGGNAANADEGAGAGPGEGTGAGPSEGSGAGDSGAEVAVPRSRGLWVWTNYAASDDTVKAQVFELALEQGVDTLYMQTNTLINIGPELLAQFVEDAATHNLKVELLFGKHIWASPENHATAVAVAQQVVDFVAAMPGAKPTAVHYDVEPHALSGWSDNREAMTSDLLDLLDKLNAVYDPAGIPIVYDMPNWFDNFSVERNGIDRPASELIIDRVSHVVIMDYTDDVPTAISRAQGEIAYATSKGKGVSVSLETSCNTDASVSFCQEGPDALHAALGAISSHFDASAGFYGVAIHHYESYRALVQ